jgi:hypothetical protein
VAVEEYQVTLPSFDFDPYLISLLRPPSQESKVKRKNSVPFWKGNTPSRLIWQLLFNYSFNQNTSLGENEERF